MNRLFRIALDGMAILMTRTQPMFAASGLLILAGLAGAARPEEVPLGHKDFYPSPERPVGFRGDGNGYFPGATPVSQWCEGTVAARKDGSSDVLVMIDKKAHNVVWKTEMPSWANTQPIVVGDRVFTTAEPNLLVCVHASTGKVLWVVSANPWELTGVARPQAEKIQAMYDIWREAIPHFDRMCGNGTMSRRVPSREFTPIADAFVEKVIPRIVKRLNELDPGGEYDEPARITVQAVKRYSKALSESEKPGFKGKPPEWRSEPLHRQMTRLRDALGNRINGYGGFIRAGRKRTPKIPLEVPWGHLVGLCMSAPVSDGQYVYASFGQGQTVCHDLNGKRIWGVHYTPNPQKDNLSGVASPLLAGDVMVDMHGGDQVLRGLDKRTGNLLWEAPTKAEGMREGGGYYVGSHKVVRLSKAGKAVDVIVTTLCNILRASDGRVLGRLPFDFRPSGGPSIVGSGGIVLKGATGDNYRSPYVAYELRLVGDDKVDAREIWRTRRSSTPDYQGVVLTPTALLMASREHTALETRTGKFLFRSQRWPKEIAGYSNIVAGKVFLWAESGSRNWGGRGDEVFGTFGSADMADLSRMKIISNKNVLGGVNKPRVPAMETYAPELYALKFYTGNAYGWPAHFLHTDTALFPSGNRLYIRSASHLYCIGDPKVPYDWNPVSRGGKRPGRAGSAGGRGRRPEGEGN